MLWKTQCLGNLQTFRSFNLPRIRVSFMLQWFGNRPACTVYSRNLSNVNKIYYYFRFGRVYVFFHRERGLSFLHIQWMQMLFACLDYKATIFFVIFESRKFQEILDLFTYLTPVMTLKIPIVFLSSRLPYKYVA